MIFFAAFQQIVIKRTLSSVQTYPVFGANFFVARTGRGFAGLKNLSIFSIFSIFSMHGAAIKSAAPCYNKNQVKFFYRQRREKNKSPATWASWGKQVKRGTATRAISL